MLTCCSAERLNYSAEQTVCNTSQPLPLILLLLLPSPLSLLLIPQQHRMQPVPVYLGNCTVLVRTAAVRRRWMGQCARRCGSRGCCRQLPLKGTICRAGPRGPGAGPSVPAPPTWPAPQGLGVGDDWEDGCVPCVTTMVKVSKWVHPRGWVAAGHARQLTSMRACLGLGNKLTCRPQSAALLCHPNACPYAAATCSRCPPCRRAQG